jgi:DNA-binding CsgD family transcriptional regulator
MRRADLPRPAGRRELTLRQVRGLDCDAADLPVTVAWLEASLFAARGQTERARRCYQAGLQIPGGGDEPVWHRTLLRQAYGRFLLSTGDLAAAQEQLQAAAATFERLGAAPYLERTRALLAQAAVPPPLAHPTWHAGLTERERDTAALVGRGWTNREIAAELYVAAKTVEYHLRNVYLKLHLDGRRELRDVVQQAA